MDTVNRIGKIPAGSASNGVKIYFASDHAGFVLKEALVPFVRDTLGFETEDLGAVGLEPDDDYPEIVAQAARKVSVDAGSGIESRAVIMGKSGQGEAIVANRFPRVRAVVFYGGPDEIITLSRMHNDANVLSLGAGFLTEEEAKTALQHWLSTNFSDEPRHARRVSAIETVTELE